MNMEKLLIKNFAGLKEVTIEVSPITGFIGPQASGKSVIAKLLYFFREIGSRLPEAVREGMDNAGYQAKCLDRFSRYFPVENTGASNFEITYWSGSENVRVVFSKDVATVGETLGLDWSDFFRAAIERFKVKQQPLLDRHGTVDDEAVHTLLVLREEYDEEASKVLGPRSNYEQIFIPAGRAFFLQLRETVFTSIEAGESLDPFMVAFGSVFEKSKSVLEKHRLVATDQFVLSQRQNDFLRSTFNKIMRAEIERFDKQEVLRYDDGRFVKLAQASSGQQEALPLLLLLAHFFTLRHRRGRAVYIEEPEAHLFPSTQKQIVEFIAEVFRARQRQMSLILTTHSPYILTSINNLLQAGKLYSGATPDVKKRLEGVIPLSRTLKPGEVGFYALENGGAKSIIDSETGLIDAAVIDEVSDDIATQFDELLLEGNEKR
jgi:hypothetical protein